MEQNRSIASDPTGLRDSIALLDDAIVEIERAVDRYQAKKNLFNIYILMSWFFTSLILSGFALFFYLDIISNNERILAIGSLGLLGTFFGLTFSRMGLAQRELRIQQHRLEQRAANANELIVMCSTWLDSPKNGEVINFLVEFRVRRLRDILAEAQLATNREFLDSRL